MEIIDRLIEFAALIVSFLAIYHSYKANRTATQTQENYQKFLKENIRNNYDNIVKELTENVKKIGLFGTQIWLKGTSHPNLNSAYHEISKLNSEMGINLFRVYQFDEFKTYGISEDTLSNHAVRLYSTITQGSYETAKFAPKEHIASLISKQTQEFMRLLDKIH